MSFPRYPAYKESGVEWLGEMPEHWNAAPIKHFGRLKGGAGFPHEKQGQEDAELSFHKVNALGKADQRGVLPTSENTITRETAKELGAFVFPPRAIVFAKVGAALLMGRIRVLERDACIDNNMMGLVTRRETHDFRFAMYAMQLVRFDLIANPGAVPSLNEGQIGDFQLASPPVEEQTRIATFLDHETAKIDALIAEQQHLIELLQEKRQAVISHAVTKGLNPDAPMKDSGVEWLGEVPEHWQVTTIKRIVATPVTDGPHETPAFLDEGIPFVSAEAVSSGHIDFERIRGFISKEDHRRYSQKYIPRRDDVFMIKSGATTGVSAIVDTDAEFNIWSPLAVIRCGPEVLPRFCLHFIRSGNFLEGVTLGWTFGTQQNIGMGVIENLAIVVPPLAVQHQIVELLDSMTHQSDALMGEVERAIYHLKERRSALISAAVTGQIDVRGLVPEAVAV